MDHQEGVVSDSCDDYCTIHESTVRKARKEHACSACATRIMPGHYYRHVFTLFDRDVAVFKRCGACDATWHHLKRLCDERNDWDRGANLYPREDLSCGLSYEEEWGDLPDEIAALPMMGDDERGRLLAPKEESHAGE